MQEIGVLGLVYGKADRFIAVVSFLLWLGLYFHGGRLGLRYVAVFLVDNRQYGKSEAALKGPNLASSESAINRNVYSALFFS